MKLYKAFAFLMLVSMAMAMNLRKKFRLDPPVNDDEVRRRWDVRKMLNHALKFEW